MATTALERALARLAGRLEIHLGRLRARGRSAALDPIGGLAIEDGEAERILDQIARGPRAETAAGAAGGSGAPAGGGLTDEIEPLVRAGERFGLSAFEREVVLLGLAPEIDARFCRLFGYLNDSVVAFRPTVGLAVAALGHGPGACAELEAFLPGGVFARFALLEVEGDGPLAGRALRLAAQVWPRLCGLDAGVAGVPAAVPPDQLERLDQLILAPGQRAAAERAARWWRDAGPRGVVTLSGEAGAGREALARAVARELDRAVVTITPRPGGAWPSPEVVSREARWHDAAALIVDAPAEVIAGYLGRAPVPLLLVNEAGGRRGGIPVERPVLAVDAGGFDRARRAELWRRLAPELDDPGRAALAGHFRLGPGRIVEVVTRARELAAGGDVTRPLLEQQAGAAAAVRLDGLATPVSPPPSDQGLVLLPATRRELDIALAWARRRADTLADGGAGAHLGLAGGLVCLFWGPPGTGKTLAARTLAREAGVALYRVDLAEVVSKYIGETEKRLSALLDEAERGDVAIFFDEADALFGRRTELHDAHDRYANIETGFLLQRLETTTAMVLLASNVQQNLDPAFLRRLHVVAEFPPPGPDERRALWDMLLPTAATEAGLDDRSGAGAAAADGIDREQLARLALTGGEIRNAVATALVTAAPEPPAMPHLVWGVCRELAKAGRLTGVADFGPWQDLAVAFARGQALHSVSSTRPPVAGSMK